MFWNDGHIEKGNLLTYPRSSDTGWIYEVLRIINNCPVFINEHFKRLLFCAQATKTNMPFSLIEISRAIFEIILLEKIETGNIRIQTEIKTGKTLIGIIPHHYPSQQDYLHGINTQLVNLERKNPNLKSWNLAVRKKADNIIRSTGVSEVILVNKSGHITEGSRSNIFGIKKNKLITPPVASVLPGITRQIILHLANELNIPVSEKIIHRDEISEFESFFISGTSPGILPVKTINEYKFTCNSLSCNTLRKAYNNLIQQDIYTTKQKYSIGKGSEKTKYDNK